MTIAFEGQRDCLGMARCSLKVALGVLLVAGAPVALPASSDDVKFERGRYQTVASTYFVHNVPLSGVVAWIDNDRIIFDGYEPDVDRVSHNAGVAPGRGIYIFDTRIGTASRYSGGILRCFGRGYIRYTIVDAMGKESVREGLLGGEQDAGLWKELPKRGVENKFSCKIQSRESVVMIEGVVPKLLLEEHGYLDITVPLLNTWNNPVHFVKVDQEIVTLPFSQREMRLPDIRYFPYQDAYVLYDRHASEIPDRTDTRKRNWIGVAKKIYVLRSDGSYSVQQVPYHDWHRGRGAFYLTKTGLVMVSQSRGTRSNPFHRELFLIQADRWESLLDGGSTSHAGVSPDGCKIAIGIAKEPKPNQRPLLHVIDVCNKGGRQ